jgi:hypothetical protein
MIEVLLSSSKEKLLGADGTKNPMPRLVDSAKNPIDVLVGNGSKVKVLYKAFDWTFAGKSGTSLDLQAVQVLDLVPYGEDLMSRMVGLLRKVTTRSFK